MTKLSCDSLCGKETTSGRMLGVCYIISMKVGVTQGVVKPPPSLHREQ